MTPRRPPPCEHRKLICAKCEKRFYDLTDENLRLKQKMADQAEEFNDMLFELRQQMEKE